jgi:hypothetical protein
MQKFKIIVIFLLCANLVFAQTNKHAALDKVILTNDSLLFNIGFNTCDISQFDVLLSDKFEFFHDKDSISNKTTFLYNLKNGLCIDRKTYQSRRELVAGNTEIYPLYKDKTLYGVVQIGRHRFYEKITDKPERFASTARFTHIWLLENGVWKLTKSFSYDHQIE